MINYRLLGVLIIIEKYSFDWYVYLQESSLIILQRSTLKDGLGYSINSTSRAKADVQLN